MIARAIRMATQGGPEVLQLQDIEIGSPGNGEVLVRQTACGLNFLDVYHRSGVYPLPTPSGCGSEAAGFVEAVGPDVSAFSVGDRVAYRGDEPGAYADLRILPATRLVKVPDEVSDEDAAAILLKGMTVEYLLNRCVTLKAGDFALMYAAAGGVGLIAGQWAKHLGIKLIGVAGGEEKCAKALSNGYFAVIDRDRENIVARVKEITGGKGLPVVFDSVGKATFDTTIACLRPRGVVRLVRRDIRSSSRRRGLTAAEERIAVLYPPYPCYLCGLARGIRRFLNGGSPSGGEWRPEARDRETVPARRGRPGSCRSRKRSYQRIHDPDSLTAGRDDIPHEEFNLLRHRLQLGSAGLVLRFMQ